MEAAEFNDLRPLFAPMLHTVSFVLLEILVVRAGRYKLYDASFAELASYDRCWANLSVVWVLPHILRNQ